MNRAQLEALRARMVDRYAAQLVQEQPHLTDVERATLCLGFDHGVGWFVKVLETQGALRLDAGACSGLLCSACRVAVPPGADVRLRVREGVTHWVCPQCGAEAEQP